MKTFVSLCGVVVFVASVSGCACKPGPTASLRPEYQADPVAVSFSACPTKDESNMTVRDVFPDTQKISITNASRTPGGLKLTIGGQDAAAFSVSGTPPTAIAGSATEEISIAFSPSKRGDLKGELTISDEFDGTDDVKVTLIGEGKNLPAQPSIETGPQKSTGTGFNVCADGSPVFDCTAEFPDTLFDKTETRQIKIRNTGCPALKITSLAIESRRGDSQGYRIVEPATLPSATSPLLLSAADGTQEITVTIAFSPTDDGSGDIDRSAELVILSNDPRFGDGLSQPARVSLTGNAVKPSIYAVPSLCDFSNPNDRCGYSSKTADKSQFRLTNDGSTPIKIASHTFASTGSQTNGVGTRFRIMTSIAGMTLAPNASATLEVLHTDMPTYVSDQIEVKATLADGVTSAGSVTLNVFGGTKPCLSTDPLDTLNFNNPATEESAQTIKIKNGTGCGTLIVNEVRVDSNPFFSIIDPPLAANTQIAAGQEAEVQILYRRPASGGMQISTLHVRTNDSDYGPPQYKLLQLISQSPLDEVPVAEIRGCTPAQLVNDANCAMGATPSMTTTLANISGNPKKITLSGITSYDPVPNMPGQKRAATKYKFSLLPPLPAGVTTADLANHDMQITTPTTELTIPAGVTGLFRVALVVFDDRNQQSGNVSSINVNVLP
ncbi:MAG: choice-of-anchor D domain-containing protein [Archangium sp.]|nr:choice-of-anchor D domain-containing protein [Archangium sp.]